jgi:hypothetical protein
MEIVEEKIIKKVEEKTNEKQTNKYPKRKPNHFLVYDKKNNKYEEMKYISQTDLAEGYRQVLPNSSIKSKKLINHFSITLCFLPEYLWGKLKYLDESYKKIKDGITLYSIVETNQDQIMIALYNELIKTIPDKMIINFLIDELDETQHSSWLVLRGKYYMETGTLFEPNYITL